METSGQGEAGTVTSHDLQEIRDYLIVVAKDAGSIIRNAQPTSSTISSKKNTADIVTVTDRAVEQFIRERLTKRYPSFNFIGEETFNGGRESINQPTFIVDPIDGTSNFVHRFPAVCVSIRLVIGRHPTVGVVYNPVTEKGISARVGPQRPRAWVSSPEGYIYCWINQLSFPYMIARTLPILLATNPYQDELWSGVRGQGAFTTQGNCTPQRLPLESRPLGGLQMACIGIEWSSVREGPSFELNLKVFTTLTRSTATGGRLANSLRCIGSAAITICRVAAGQQDAFCECGCWEWDVAAAWCILVEAGGIMVDGHPGEWDPPIDNRRYLAVRSAISGQREFVEEFWDVIGEDRSSYGPSLGR